MSHKLLIEWLLITLPKQQRWKRHTPQPQGILLHLHTHTTTLFTPCYVSLYICVSVCHVEMSRGFLHVFAPVENHGCVGVCLGKIWEAKKAKEGTQKRAKMLVFVMRVWKKFGVGGSCVGRDRRGGRHTGKERQKTGRRVRDSYQEHFSFVLSAGHRHKKQLWICRTPRQMQFHSALGFWRGAGQTPFKTDTFTKPEEGKGEGKSSSQTSFVALVSWQTGWVNRRGRRTYSRQWAKRESHLKEGGKG